MEQQSNSSSSSHSPATPLVDISEHFIDVQGVFQQKNPRLARWIPRFVFNYLRRIIHEKEVNETLYLHRDKMGLDFIRAVLIDKFKMNIQTTGLERVPAQGRYIVIANHPLGGLDGMALLHVIGQLRPDIRFPVNDILMNLPHLRPLFIPINKHGSNKENMQLFNDAFASDDALLFFPAGLVSRRQKGKVEDLEWHKTFLVKAIQHQRTIIPAFIGGQNSNFFYRLANWRKWLGIKANIEMLYLADEMFLQSGKTLPVTFGTPIPPAFFDRSHRPEQWAAMLKAYVYRLAQQPDAVFPSAPSLPQKTT